MRDFSIIKQRILQYLENKGVSKYECYQKTGITNGVFSQKSGISEDNLLSFLSYYKDINHTWLLTGDGPMLRASKEDDLTRQQLEPTILYIDNPDKNDLIVLQRDRIKSLEAEIKALKRGSVGGSVVSEDYPPVVEIVSNVTHNKS